MIPAANIIPFPARAARYEQPLRQAMSRTGMPVRKGDSVTVTDTATRKFAGTVSKIGIGTDQAISVLYEVSCNDGLRRVVAADQIEALS
jgi:hypothetical protein